jgi:hypothetical protein
LLLQELGVRPQLFEAQTGRVATKPLEFELEQRVQIAPAVRGGDLLHDAALSFALGRIALTIRVQLLDEPAVDGAQAVLPQLFVPPGPLLRSTCGFPGSRVLLRSVAAPLSAAELVCELGGGGSGLLFGHVRAQLRHVNIKSELLEDGSHSGLRLLHIVLHRLRIADVVQAFE